MVLLRHVYYEKAQLDPRCTAESLPLILLLTCPLQKVQLVGHQV